MAEVNSGKNMMARDTVIYMLAKGCEAVVGAITLSVMSRIYLPEQSAVYTMLNTTFTTIAMFSCQWLVQSVMRYINKYEIKNRLREFYSTAFLSWLRVNLAIIFLMALFLMGINAFGGDFLEVYPMSLLISAVLMFVSYSSAQLVVAMLAAVRMAKTNLFLSVSYICGSLALLVLFVKLWGSRVEFIFISYFIMDLFMTVFGVYKLQMFKYIDLKGFDKEIFRDFFAYGFPLMGNLITTQILNKSDVFIITYFRGRTEAGIYSQNYAIVSSVFTMLAAAVMRGSYPTILRAWSEGFKEKAAGLVNEAVRNYLILGVPAVCGVFALQDKICGVMLDPKYFAGHIIMGPVALGMLFLGLTEYSIKGWELNSMTKNIFYRSLIGGLVNIGVNLVLIPYFGIIAAAVSTFIGFFVYFCLARFGTRKLIRFRLPIIRYIRIIGSGLIMAAVLAAVKKILPDSLMALGGEVILGVIIYFALLYSSGEMREEIKGIFRKFTGICKN